MAAGQSGEFYCAWLDLRGQGTQVFGSRSADGGTTWSKNRLVYRSPGGTVCECCHPSVAIDSQGLIHVMWRNFLDGNRDMYLATSRDHGETFDPAATLGGGSWALNACPMDGGALAVSRDGRVNTAWQRNGTALMTDGGEIGEHVLGAGMQPWIAADIHGAYAVWLNSRAGKLYLAKSPAAAPSELADDAAYPVIAAHPARSGPVVIAWEAEDDSQPCVKLMALESK